MMKVDRGPEICMNEFFQRVPNAYEEGSQRLTIPSSAGYYFARHWRYPRAPFDPVNYPQGISNQGVTQRSRRCDSREGLRTLSV